jgi:ribose-phosphate pyrophosphokinase
LNTKDLMVFAGSANLHLAEKVAEHLNIKLGKATVGRFSDGETMVELLENVRGKDVFVLQSTSHPTNDHLMEIMVMVDALRRSSAARITVAITAKVVANMLTSVGVNRLLTMDLHSDQIQGFFDIPVDNIYATPVLLEDLMKKAYENLVIVSPDVGGVVRARACAKILGSDLAIIDKRRPKPNVSEVMNIIGDVANRTCVIIDDIVDTANTLCEAASALKKQGATHVVAYATHAIFSGDAIDSIDASELDEIVITDTITLRQNLKKSKKIRQVSVAKIMAETIRRISHEDSVSSLFMD